MFYLDNAIYFMGFNIRLYIVYYNINMRKTRRGTKCDCKINWLWVQTPLKEMKYLFTFIFSFHHSGVKAKRGVEFRHLTRNASQNLAESGERGLSSSFFLLNTRFSLPTLLKKINSDTITLKSLLKRVYFRNQFFKFRSFIVDTQLLNFLYRTTRVKSEHNLLG